MGSPPLRPRISADRHAELLDAVVRVLHEVGYEALSMDLVAQRAKCSKATLYRRWSGKSEMVVAAIKGVNPPLYEEIDTGSLRRDLIALAEQMSTFIEKGASLAAVIHRAVMADGELARAVHNSLLKPELDFVELIVMRAIDRGELRTRPSAVDFLHHMLAGASMGRPSLDEISIPEDHLVRFVDEVVLPALHAGGG